MTITIADLAARIDAVKRAPLLMKQAAAEVALSDLMQYLAAQDSRIAELEKGIHDGTRTATQDRAD